MFVVFVLIRFFQCASAGRLVKEQLATEYAPLAQLVEQLTLNQWVQGSSPWRCTIVRVFNAEGPPVPIPNTEVKLCRADNTRLETSREDR